MDRYNLNRFVEAQQDVYETALVELTAGEKTGHWMWFVFPQLAGLGRSRNAGYYGVSGHDEARAYLDHPVLGGRLRESVAAAAVHSPLKSAEAVFGVVDAMKFRSCLTLFEAVAAETEDRRHFTLPLEGFFGSERDSVTLKRLSGEEHSKRR